MTSRLSLAIVVLGLSVAACSAVGGRPSASPDPGDTATPPTHPATTSPTSPAPSASAPDSHSPSKVDGREFVSVLVTEDGVSKPLASGTKIRLAFADGMVTSSAGCNTMSGSYTLQDEKLVLGEMAMTEMGCPSDLGKQDQWLADFLGSKPTLALDGNNLVLTSDKTEVTFLDRAQAEPDQPLAGITWGLTTLIDGDVASSVPQGVSATLLFKTDGTFTFGDGCNAGGGQYSVTGNKLHLSQVVSTMMACPGDKGDVSAAVRAVLDADSVQFAIDHSTLTLTSAPHGLQYDAAVDVTN